MCDLYNTAAVIKLDGAGPQGFYNAQGVAGWLAQRLPGLTCVWLKHRWGQSGFRLLVLGFKVFVGVYAPGLRV